VWHRLLKLCEFLYALVCVCVYDCRDVQSITVQYWIVTGTKVAPLVSENTTTGYGLIVLIHCAYLSELV
jgi:hypothetical protein